VDNEKPVLVGVPANATVECDAIPAAANVTATDNCGAGAVQYSETKADGNCSGNYTLTRTWSVTDIHGNSSSATQVVTVRDTKAPVISCPADVTVNCQDDNSPAATGSATATDNCSTPAITFSDASTKSTDPNIAGFYNYTITRTWTATDVCGNSSSCVQTITVQDITNPVITCPSSVTLSCEADKGTAANGVATATDNCSPVQITSSDVSTQNSDVNNAGHYNYTITRTWRATDVTGNFSECVQTITVIDITKPVITCASNVTVNCQDDKSPAGAGTSTATDNCSPVAITYSDVSTQNSNVNNRAHYNYTITRTWRATDVTGNWSECVQTITVQDITAPVAVCK
ncbi:hypothetical protein QUB32_31115, partial [Microcoleus sp. AT8-A4]|uniref:HYR-like domain-containing protein n=1 Tax=Microcoleus sp. AT8-A4 TaxID=2818615 RepID=UPI002FD600A5